MGRGAGRAKTSERAQGSCPVSCPGSRPGSQLQEPTHAEKEPVHARSHSPLANAGIREASQKRNLSTPGVSAPLLMRASQKRNLSMPGVTAPLLMRASGRRHASAAVLAHTVNPTSTLLLFSHLPGSVLPLLCLWPFQGPLHVINPSLSASDCPMLSPFLDSPETVSRDCLFYSSPKDFLVRKEDSVGLATEEMAHKVKVPTWGSESDFLGPIWWEEKTTSCPLTSTYMCTMACVRSHSHTHTQNK